MRSKMLWLSIVVLLLTLTAPACMHRPGGDEGGRFTVLASNKDHGWLGVSVQDVTKKFAEKRSLSVNNGAYVTDVQEDSPAEEAGLKEGDVIVSVDEKSIRDSGDLINSVRKIKPGTEVNIGVARGPEKQTLKASLGSAPRMRSLSYRVPQVPRMRIAPHVALMRESNIYGLTLESLNKQLAEYFGAPDGRGVLVKSVKRNSSGADAGFAAGDVILKVEGDLVYDIDDVVKTLEDVRDDDSARVEIIRKGVTRTLHLVVDENDRLLGFRELERNLELMIPPIAPEEFREFHFDADQIHEEMESLKEHLRDGAIDLREQLRRELKHSKVPITI